ncbi:hypothetical protein AM592_14185 [Bacillus gobiensis]|uniref:Uncharacterized protein n=1 Tax=Bacillus gobiensis TaxID=1441095 RepID=A0A0M3RA57_9BACI|nr:hypothetical protein AM592_14185 [Bacillus gobiensis]
MVKKVIAQMWEGIARLRCIIAQIHERIARLGAIIAPIRGLIVQIPRIIAHLEGLVWLHCYMPNLYRCGVKQLQGVIFNLILIICMI